MKKMFFFFITALLLVSCKKQSTQADQFVGTWTMFDTIVQTDVYANAVTKSFVISKMDDNTLAVRYFPVNKMYFPMKASLGEDAILSTISSGNYQGDIIISNFRCNKKNFSEFTYTFSQKTIGSDVSYTHRGRCQNNNRYY